MWLRTKTDSGLETLINLDHATHIFANPHGTLIVLDNAEQSIGTPAHLDSIQAGLEYGKNVWEPAL